MKPLDGHHDGLGSGHASRHYSGRFAPSPTGPLHAGSLVAAVAAWLDARAHGGRWLLRIEDLDPPREQPGAADAIVHSLARLGMVSDAPVMRQSDRHAQYEAALAALIESGHAYPCGCTRREIADSQPVRSGEPVQQQELVYPGTCRNGLPAGRAARAWRLRVPTGVVRFEDRALGLQEQDLGREVGDFVLRRADGLWAYQLAVVVDDAAQAITDVVRGDDLLASTARQMVLQRALGLDTPRYLHVPVVLAADGQKLSKQTGARGIDEVDPITALDAALAHLGVAGGGPYSRSVSDRLAQAVELWRTRYGGS
jgi:glutamyl-Q tRNA(Asp) synthetase